MAGEGELAHKACNPGDLRESVHCRPCGLSWCPIPDRSERRGHRTVLPGFPQGFKWTTVGRRLDWLAYDLPVSRGHPAVT